MSRFIGVGHVPTFLVRGLAMPVVSSCTTLAVMRAVPGKQSGLASGAGASRLLIAAVIPRGFPPTALTCLVLCSGAAALAFFLRRRGRNRSMANPAQQEEQHLAVSRNHDILEGRARAKRKECRR